MIKKGTKLYSIVNGKCPKCNEGDFFKYKISLNPSNIIKLHDNCENCNLRYMVEPSFYFGAMYVNYGITVALFVAFFIITKLILGLTLLQSFAVIFFATLILTPLNLRLSRILWINMFIDFKSKATDN